MAAEPEDQEEVHEASVDESPSHKAEIMHDDETEGGESDVEEEQEEEDDEPKLKYARMTGYLASVYRNGDATSAFLVAGDKMVCRQSLERQRRRLTIYSSLAHTMGI